MLNALITVALLSAPPPCNDRQVWDPDLVAQVKAGVAEILKAMDESGVAVDAAQRARLQKRLFGKVLWRLVRAVVVGADNHNSGVVPLRGVKTAKGQPVTLFRTGFTPRPTAKDSCFRALVDGGVRHVLNLYGGPMQTADLEAEERQVVEQAGGTYFLARDAGEEITEWRERLRKKKDTAGAAKAVARIINEQILHPGGAAPRGHIHIHCGGGMHRTGMVVAVIDRCLNGASQAKVVADYKKHVAWRSADRPGGYEQENVDFALGFDCTLLKR